MIHKCSIYKCRFCGREKHVPSFVRPRPSCCNNEMDLVKAGVVTKGAKQ